MLNVKGRSDLFLRLEIIKKIVVIPVIIIGVFLGIKIMIIGMIVINIIAYFLNSYYSGKLIGYSSLEQIKDVAPSFLISFFLMGLVFILGYIMNLSPLVELIIQISFAIFIIITFCELIKFQEFLYLKKILLEKIKK
jgi:teichuronic acid exporter